MTRWTALPFVRYVVALAVGIIAYLVGGLSVSLAIGLLAFGTLVLLLCFFGPYRRLGRIVPLLRGLAIGLTLIGLGGLVTDSHTESHRPDHLLGLSEPIAAYEAVIATPVEQRPSSYRAEAQVRRVRIQSGWVAASGRVQLRFEPVLEQKPRYGDVLLIRSAPQTVSGIRNPGAFDYRRYLAFRQIHHQQYLRRNAYRLLQHDPPSRRQAWACEVHELADRILTRHLGAGEEFAVVKAMVLGSRDAIDPGLQDAYSVAGAVHVLSVSGLHVGVLFLALQFLLRFLEHKRYGKYLFAGIVLAVLWFYALMTGFSAPVLRSVVMFSLILVSKTLGRQHQLVNTLAVSAFLILLLDPYALTTVGFQLSYLAVGGLALWQRPLYLVMTPRFRWLDWLWQITSVALVAQLVTSPLSIHYFYQFPTYFWLVNPVVIPLSSLVLVLGLLVLVLAWVPMVSTLLGWLLKWCMWALNEAVRLTESLPGASFRPLNLSAVEVGLLYLVIVLLIGMVTTRRKAFLWPAAALSILLAFLGGWHSLLTRQQRLFMVSHQPRQTVLQFIRGRNVCIQADAEALSPDRIRFFLRGTWDSLGVVGSLQAEALPRPVQVENDWFALGVWEGKSFLILKRPLPPEFHSYVRVDYGIVSRNAIRSWRELGGRMDAGQWILDTSNRPRLAQRLWSEARTLGQRCHSVDQQGAFLDKID